MTKRLSLLFDLDGTLTDPKEGISKSIVFALNELGVTVPPGFDFGWSIGPPLSYSFAKMLGEKRVDEVPLAIQLYRQRYGKLGLYENKVYDGIVPALKTLGKSCDLYVATSKPRVYAEEILNHFSLKDFFKQIYGAEFDGKYGDKAELIAMMTDKEKLAGDAMVMIGDRMHDMIAAQKNGIRGVGVVWGYGSREELLDAGAAALVEEPGHLPPYFLKSSMWLNGDALDVMLLNKR